MRKGQRIRLSHLPGLSLGLFCVWILLSGKLEIKFLIVGFLAAMIISYICLPFLTVKRPGSNEEFFVFSVSIYKAIRYILWLLKEITKASLDVSREILKKEMDYIPRIIYFSMPFKNPVASVILANSIILTPGTITFDVTQEGVFEVHSLNKYAADDLLTGEMARKVAWLFGETCEFTPLPEKEIRNIPKEVS